MTKLCTRRSLCILLVMLLLVTMHLTSHLHSPNWKSAKGQTITAATNLTEFLVQHLI